MGHMPRTGPQDLTTRTPLSEQHVDMLRLLAHGMTDAAAAARLGLTERTLRRRLSDVMGLLGASSRFQAGYATGRLRLVDDGEPPVLASATAKDPAPPEQNEEPTVEEPPRHGAKAAQPDHEEPG